eukprot:m.11954 g.11954  ORF g.11954 m.11954 type:complete len:183 (+) comp5786_c0_seq2:152-700(+)
MATALMRNLVSRAVICRGSHIKALKATGACTARAHLSSCVRVASQQQPTPSTMASYHFNVTIAGSFDEAIAKVTEELKKEGFGIISEIDVKATMKKKIDVDMPGYKILGACNPKLAYQAISAEADIGLLLPCNVVVREEGDAINVGFMDPAAVMGLVDKEGVAELAATVKGKLEKVQAALQA